MMPAMPCQGKPHWGALRAGGILGLALLASGLSGEPARAAVDVGAGLGPDMFAYRARRVPHQTPAHPIAMALEDLFGERLWESVEISTNGPAFDISHVMRRGYYKLEVIQLILMSVEAELTLAHAFKRREKGVPLSELAGSLGLDFEDIYEKSLAVQKRLDEEFLPWYREGGGAVELGVDSASNPSGETRPKAAARASLRASGDVLPGREAYAILEELLRSGNRHAGAPQRPKAVEALAREMERRGLSVERQPFSMADPRDGRAWPMVNLIGRFNPEASCRFLLGSHFDTRHVAENDPDPARRTKPIAGANDGTSGVAVLLALSSRLSRILPEGVGADIVLFDGEEMGYPDVGGYCGGSKHFARRLPDWRARPRFGIILDMVCDPRGVYRTELRSMKAHPGLVDALWKIGESLEPRAFSRKPQGMVDDHVALTEAGVPSVLLIGFNYPEWHTSADTLERCSPGRLGLVQEVLEEFLRRRLGGFLEGCRSYLENSVTPS